MIGYCNVKLWSAAEPGPVRLLQCRSRARLMRALSETLMEAGADLSDGITLTGADGRVHIAPAEDREALRISATAQSLCEDYARMAQAAEDRLRA